MRLAARILGRPTMQSTAKGASANRQRKVRKSPTTFDEIRFGAQKSTRMPSLMPYSTAHPLPGSNMHTHRFRVGWSSSSPPSSVLLLAEHVVGSVSAPPRPASMPRPAKSCWAAEYRSTGYSAESTTPENHDQ